MERTYTSYTVVNALYSRLFRPTGFLNAANQLRMHPSDTRMSSWTPGTYTVGSSSVSSFPMALFKSVNSPLTIVFTATSSQTGAATLRIGTTLSFAGGRPQVTVRTDQPVIYPNEHVANTLHRSTVTRALPRPLQLTSTLVVSPAARTEVWARSMMCRFLLAP
jgi:hypothetical protein